MVHLVVNSCQPEEQALFDYLLSLQGLDLELGQLAEDDSLLQAGQDQRHQE